MKWRQSWSSTEREEEMEDAMKEKMGEEKPKKKCMTMLRQKSMDLFHTIEQDIEATVSGRNVTEGKKRRFKDIVHHIGQFHY